MGLFTRRNCVKRSASSDSGEMTGGSTASGGRHLNRRMSMIQEMQSQLPRLSLFEIHVNNSNKIPTGSNRPVRLWPVSENSNQSEARKPVMRALI